MTEEKAFVSALSTAADWRDAVGEAGKKAREGLGGAPCDLALVFVTELYEGLEPAAVPAALGETLPYRALVGCNSSGVIGGRREVEMEPAVTVLAMRLPGVKASSFYVSPEDGKAEPARLLRTLDLYPTDQPKFLAFADPMTCDIESWVGQFNEAYPGAPVIGGLASGLAIGRPNWLWANGEAYGQGAVGVALTGDVAVDVLVAQGCRPIGAPLTITKADGHVLQELGGRPPLDVLRGVIQGLSAQDQELARHSLFAGVAMDEYRDEFKRGDFLVRNLMGYDASTGALMIGTSLRAGHTLQFQLRDARTSEEDLRVLLERLDGGSKPCGGLLVSCCGRGKGLYGRPDHDTSLIQSLRGPMPLAGFFANGEIGPVGRRNYIHGYTSSLALIR